MTNKNVMLIAPFNDKGIGIHYLEASLIKNGFCVPTVFYNDMKTYNYNPEDRITETEIQLVKNQIQKYKPFMIVISIFCSMYMDTMDSIIKMIKENFDIPLVATGGFPTLYVDYFLDKGISFVIRSDGDFAISRLANALYNKTDYEQIPSLCFRKNGQTVLNRIEVAADLEEYGIASVVNPNSCIIQRNKLTKCDPRKLIYKYEIITSRGCDYNCSYCFIPKLRNLLPEGIKPIRMRSVKSVIEELKEAKKKLKKICYIRFTEETIPDDDNWIDEFVSEYKKQINLPFSIWIQPKMVIEKNIKKFVKAGLIEAILGIQSGSEHIRKDIFRRYETNEEILKAAKIIKDAGISIVYHDFLLRHPFESIEDLKQSYHLIKQLPDKYMLSIGDLAFFPGADLTTMAVEAGHYTKEEMEFLKFAPIGMKLPLPDKTEEFKHEQDIWYKMIFCTQFKNLRKKIESFEDNPLNHEKEIKKLFNIALKQDKTQRIMTKVKYVLNRIKCII